MTVRIQRSVLGQDFGRDQHNVMMARQGYRSGDGVSSIMAPGAYHSAHFDDFLGAALAYGTTIVERWRSRVGTTNAVAFTRTGAVNGTAVGTIGDTTASMAVSGVQIDSDLQWRASSGQLTLETRIKLSAITNIACFVGFTDQVSALEMPIHSAASANTITTNASNGLGFFFDTSMTDDNWWVAGVKANTDATHEDTDIPPVAATYQRLRVEVGTSGNARFFINGAQVGSQMADAVTAATLLTPVVAGFNRTTSGTPTITLDYLGVSSLRE